MFLKNKAIQLLHPFFRKLIDPSSLGNIAVRLPEKLNCFVITRFLNFVLSEHCNDGEFNFLQDRLLQIEITDARLFIGISFFNQKVHCRYLTDIASDADVTLSISSNCAIQLIQQEVDPDTLFFQRKLKINGDTELAHYVKNTLDSLSPDVIPYLARQLLNEYRQLLLVSR